MQLPPFDSLVFLIKDAIRAARETWRHQYIALSYHALPAGEYQIQPEISGAAFLIVHPTGELVCFRRSADGLFQQVRAALGS